MESGWVFPQGRALLRLFFEKRVRVVFGSKDFSPKTHLLGTKIGVKVGIFSRRTNSFPKLDKRFFFRATKQAKVGQNFFGKTPKSSHQSNQKLSALDHPIAKRRFGLVQKKFGQLTKFGETIFESHQKLSGRLSCFWSRAKKGVWSSFGNDPLGRLGVGWVPFWGD